jgi:hypothetical protein
MNMNKIEGSKEFLIDILIMLGGVLVTVLSVWVFLYPEAHPVFFSFIFSISGIISYVLGSRYLKARKNFWKMSYGALLMLVSVSLFIMTILSILTL